MIAQRGTISRVGRATVLATVAAVTFTAVQPTLAFAGSAPAEKGVVAKTANEGGLTDVSARRRHYRGNGGAAAAAAFAGIVGTGLAIAAAQNRRSYYEDNYYYGRPAYYGYGPGYHYYGGGNPYYGGGYYNPW
ncbi:conserved hypothetical protein; putative signal peptide [Bradyrhizobium sp. ORS 278]|uniref:hypothetical protein n=1 Tax=Bradyrhizobium sp. (strain ORS 278) TaxID=114615 RepID=UPI0001508D08|nr:hypothetical protein [Bradyrhizobium sp. ORS 278]CAL80186.1 conserved hypothetical protein; putative signal peptide [Bradyrhizobium sp. ORS 278]